MPSRKATLPITLLRTFAQHYNDGLTYKQIAEALDLPGTRIPFLFTKARSAGLVKGRQRPHTRPNRTRPTKPQDFSHLRPQCIAILKAESKRMSPLGRMAVATLFPE